ncbi:MAG: hypothetical protein JNN07_10390 [Verrucomicrobiales bacterium]|nr:hypothetical protein [Verrucomicrobiales bacterium]
MTSDPRVRRKCLPGSVICVPRQVPHGFKNIGDSPLHLIIALSPAGFEEWFARCATEFTNGRIPEPEEMARLAAEHGMSFLDEAAGHRSSPSTFVFVPQDEIL